MDPTGPKALLRVPAVKEVFPSGKIHLSKGKPDLDVYLWFEKSYTMIPDKIQPATVSGEQFQCHTDVYYASNEILLLVTYNTV